MKGHPLQKASTSTVRPPCCRGYFTSFQYICHVDNLLYSTSHAKQPFMTLSSNVIQAQGHVRWKCCSLNMHVSTHNSQNMEITKEKWDYWEILRVPSEMQSGSTRVWKWKMDSHSDQGSDFPIPPGMESLVSSSLNSSESWQVSPTL